MTLEEYVAYLDWIYERILPQPDDDDQDEAEILPFPDRHSVHWSLYGSEGAA